ncbi:hypothetical protein AS005_03685 [Thermotoga sp. KOL6]|nr:hypothetical protein AS005_03685 [Thermotoga sp. KOL6]
MKPAFYLLGSVVIASFSGILIKSSSLPPGTIAFYRLLIASLLFLTVKRKRCAFSFHDEMLSILSGFLLAMHFYFWVSAFKHTTVTGAVIPLTLQPVVTSFFSYLFYKEKLTLFQLLTGSTVVLGVLIAVFDKGSISNVSKGDLMAIVGVLFFCGYLIVGRSLNKKMGSFNFSMRTHIVATMILLVLGTPSFKIVDVKEWFILIVLGAGCSFLGYLLINISLKYFPSSVVSIALVGEPALAILWSSLMLRESATLFQILGFAISVIGLLLFLIKT